MAIPANIQDVYETSSFSSLIQQEESEEIIPFDLHVACLIGDMECVQDFIRQDADLNKINRGGWTPLMYAAYVGRDNILKLLLQANAKVDIQSTKHGQTALMLASYCASESIICFLLQHGACINMQDHTGRTSLSHAVKQGHQSAVNLLATNGADVNISEYINGHSPLMESTISGNENISNILLSHGANLNHRSKTGETVRQLAVRKGQTVILNLIDAAAQSMCTSSETSHRQEEIDINQGPREFRQYLNRGMNNRSPLSTPSKSVMENNNYEKSNDRHVPDSTVPDMDKYKDRFSLGPSHSSLQPEIHKLFRDFNVINYLPLFEKQGIDVDAFLTLTDDDLKNMGVEKLGPRKRIKLVIERYQQIIKSRTAELEPSQNDAMEVHDMQLQQALNCIQKLQEQVKVQAMFLDAINRENNDRMLEIGKNSKEAMEQLRKIKQHQRRMDILLNDIKNHPNSTNLSSELRIDSSLFDSASSVNGAIDVASNRLDMTCKQVERTLSSSEGHRT